MPYLAGIYFRKYSAAFLAAVGRPQATDSTADLIQKL